MADQISGGIGTRVLHFPFFEIDGDKPQIHAVRHLVLGLQSTVGTPVEYRACHLIEAIQNFTGLGIDLSDVLQCIVAKQAHKSARYAVASAIYGCEHAPGIKLVEPREVTTDSVTGHVKDKLTVKNTFSKRFTRKYGPLNSPRIVNARGQVGVESVNLLSLKFELARLFGQGHGSLVDLGLHFSLVTGEVVAHGKQRLAQDIFFRKGCVLGVELTLAHRGTEFSGSF